MFNNPDVNNLPHLFVYNQYPTVADTYYQNGSFEKAHRALANYIWAMITGANLGIKFWPYVLYHAIRLFYSFPEPNATTSLIKKTTPKQENISSLWTLGCSFYMWTPVNWKSKLKNHVSKVILLRYDTHTTQNVLYCDVDTHRIKLTSRVWFD